jgi:single-strand DNA-binding protein
MTNFSNMRNQITLIGNIGDNVLITNFTNGAKVARFSLTTQPEGYEGYKIEGYKLFAWGNMAQFIERFGRKGKRIAITGRLVDRTYLNKDGKSRKVTEVEVRNVISI